MRGSWLGVLLVCLLLARPATAAEPAAADAAAVRAVIEAQLRAFQADDGAAAFSFAAPAIQAMFGDPATFMAMVRDGYRPVYRPREVEFRDLTTSGANLVQRVLFVGPDGVPVIARYTMQRQPDGSWRIGGCALERAPEETT